MQRSLVFVKLVEGRDPPCNYEINNHLYTKGYKLSSRLHLSKMGDICQNNPCASRAEEFFHFAERQESCKKDVQRPFGVLISIFYCSIPYSYVVSRPNVKGDACLCHHANMVIESDCQTRDMHARPHNCEGLLADVDNQVPLNFADFIAMNVAIHDSNTHQQL
jgi:hypothetical protein